MPDGLALVGDEGRCHPPTCLWPDRAFVTRLALFVTPTCRPSVIQSWITDGYPCSSVPVCQEFRDF
ncbi:MAG: hypothetical protein HPY83_12345 [Anaerolineae bacterium]|nr:hypothetical protein [Anaerolineae bacterium]